MDFGLKKFTGSFRSFLNESGKYFLFTALFYSIWVIRSLVLEQDFNLEDFSGRMIGACTLRAYDVGLRVSLFYKCVVFLILSFFTLNFLGFVITRKKRFLASCEETRIINYSSLVGILFLLFELFGYKTSDTLELVYFMHKLMFGSILLRLTVFTKNRLSIYTYTLIVLVSISLYFFISDWYNLAGQYKNPDFLISTFILCCLFIISAHLILKNDEGQKKQIRLNVYAYTFFPLTFLPLITVLKDEIFLILQANQIYLSSQLLIYVVLLVVLGFTIITRSIKSQKMIFISQKKLIELYYLPGLIFSLLTYVNYSYFINNSSEVFETGNKYLPLMEFNLFGVIPTLEKFNSHLLSDYFFSAIHALFYGLRGNEVELYDFLYTSFSCVLYYYLVFYITRNAFIAAFTILLFPLCGAMLPEPYAFGVFGLFALHKIVFQKQTFGNYLIFFITMAGLVLWRIDLGYTCLIAMSFMLIYYHFFSVRFKINRVPLLKALGLVLLTTALTLFILSYLRDVNLFKKIINALNYFASAQTYGYDNLGKEGTVFYTVTYFVFPITVVVLIIALLLHFRKLNVSGKQRLAYLALFYASMFYLVNFNRGLIRHSLTEGFDHFTSSFVYLILPGTIFVFYHYKSQVFKCIGFCGITFFLLNTYKLPVPGGSKSYLQQCMTKIENVKNTDLSKIKELMPKKTVDEKDQYKPFIDFIEKNTRPEETFIDFCNIPMLYFYTKKITPSYFYQNPICSHNDFLQNVFVEDLKNYKTPFLVFFETNDASRIAVDDVPNPLRHYRIAEYLYQNYKPYVQLGNLDIWKKNSAKECNAKKTIFHFEMGKDSTTSDGFITTSFEFKASKKYVARILLKEKTTIKLNINPDILAENAGITYINDTLAYKIIEPKGKLCDVMLSSKGVHSIEILESDYLPDFNSERCPSYYYRNLPYVWGNYDKHLLKEPIQFEKTEKLSLKKDTTYLWNIPENLNKESGNTFILTCTNKSKDYINLHLIFGNKNEKSKSAVTFIVVPSIVEKRYAVRLSSIYNWYNPNVNVIGLTIEGSDNVNLTNIKITKGK
jgi:hypothetical protein